MPIYEYTCGACGKTSDVFQKLNDPAPDRCEQCNAEGTLQRVVSRTSFVLKGGGWYSDLYGSTKKDSSGKDSSGKDSSGKDSSGKDSSSNSSGAGTSAASSSTSTSAPAGSSSGTSSSGSS